MANKNVMDSVNVISGDTYKSYLKDVAFVSRDILKKTLGPYAHTTIIDDGTFKYPTKDGWNILKRIQFNDNLYQTLFGFIKNISYDLVKKVGDGTTTALITACSFIDAVDNVLENNPNIRQTDIIAALNNIKGSIVSLIEKESKKIDVNGDFSDIRRIAMVSSNGNVQISDFIQKIYQETNNPNISVSIEPDKESSYHIQRGYKLDSSLLNHKAYVNNDNNTYKSSFGTYYAIFDHNVTYNEHSELISVISRIASVKQKSIVVIAPYFDEMFTLIMQRNINELLKAGQLPNIMLVQVGLGTTLQKRFIEDFAIITKSELFNYAIVKMLNTLLHPTEENISEREKILTAFGGKDDVQEIIQTHLGYTNEIEIAEKFILVETPNKGENPKYDSHLEDVTTEYEMAKNKVDKQTSSLEKPFMDAMMRYTKLKGNMGTIRVGGYSELEKMCLKDAVDDAVLACKAAYSQGYVRGMNMATLSAINSIDDKESDGSIRGLMIQLLSRVYTETVISIFENKHNRELTGASIIDEEKKLTISDIINACIETNSVYNIETEKIESFEGDAIPSVINPADTDIEILNSVISILTLILTSNQMLSLNAFLTKKKTREEIDEEEIAIFKRKADIAKDILDSTSLFGNRSIRPML